VSKLMLPMAASAGRVSDSKQGLRACYWQYSYQSQYQQGRLRHLGKILPLDLRSKELKSRTRLRPSRLLEALPSDHHFNPIWPIGATSNYQTLTPHTLPQA
jgi:hypothetical protein